jgi:PAN domain
MMKKLNITYTSILKYWMIFAFTILSTTVHSQNNTSRLNNINFPGNDIGFVGDVNDANRCETECNKNRDCKAWTWVRPRALPMLPRPNLAGFCALKGSIPNKTPDHCCISGYAKSEINNNDMITGTIIGPMETITEVDTGKILAASRQQSCQDYANNAVTQQQRNLETRCGFSGPRWNPNYNDHYIWCMNGDNLKYTKGEQQMRQVALDQCSTKYQINQGTQVPNSNQPSSLGSQQTLNHVTSMPQLKTMNTAEFSGGMLMIDALQAATEFQPDCNDLTEVSQFFK